MRGILRFLRLLLYVFAFPALLVSAFWLGLVPARMFPLAPLDLARNDQWFVDFRLAVLKADATLCQTVLRPPAIVAEPIPDVPFQDGCGLSHAVAMKEAGGAKLSAGKISCPMAGALAMWLEHEVQPAAEEILKSKVTSVRHMGTYACRNIVGVKGLKRFRSQHASVNAIDISAFVLSDGSTVSLSKHWRQEGPQSQFLHRIHRGACAYFRVAVGPDFNEAHHDHFHLDRGAFKSCK